MSESGHELSELTFLALGKQGRRVRLVHLFTPPPSSFSSAITLSTSPISKLRPATAGQARQPCGQAPLKFCYSLPGRRRQSVSTLSMSITPAPSQSRYRPAAESPVRGNAGTAARPRRIRGQAVRGQANIAELCLSDPRMREGRDPTTITLRKGPEA